MLTSKHNTLILFSKERSLRFDEVMYLMYNLCRLLVDLLVALATEFSLWNRAMCKDGNDVAVGSVRNGGNAAGKLGKLPHIDSRNVLMVTSMQVYVLFKYRAKLEKDTLTSSTNS
ncbi:hypothetical protein HAX54_025061 [Datura stramonium]|uniref:Uncharacterized protein n=1 Tax=Datura stramonium TaxID=4076 RepID=A0ABS8V105_DATST|nr:hypothetical protein [Datura stramonium]